MSFSHFFNLKIQTWVILIMIKKLRHEPDWIIEVFKYMYRKGNWIVNCIADCGNKLESVCFLC